MLDSIFEQFTDNTILLTPNRRLSAILHDHYAAFKTNRKETGWLSPTIVSINAWLEISWNKYVATTINKIPYLLNAVQAQTLLETIISSDPHYNLLQVNETARSIRAAWELICQYEVNINDVVFQSTDDYTLCQQWLITYQELCLSQHYIDSGTLPNFLISKINSEKIRSPEKIFLYGFTDVIPQHRKFLEAQGGFIEIPLAPFFKNKPAFKSLPSETPCRSTFPDADSEILAMAHFAKMVSETDPEASVGCVILELSQQRERILQLFKQVFFPDQPFDIDPAHYPFNISAGKSLSTYPVIATALLITSLSYKILAQGKFSSLLLSPYIGGAQSELIHRARFDATLRNANIHQIDLSTLESDCLLFNDHIKYLLSLDNKQKRTYREWGQHFNNMLEKMGWPGERSLSSEEYQVAHAWLAALTIFNSFDNITGIVDHLTAWKRLQQIVAEQIFQPQSPKTNIQILGVLEAAAIPFDYLWVSGLHDMSWPPQPAPHPLIPKYLQRTLNMPHATPERELQFCTSVLAQFKQTTNHLLFSHTESDGKIHLSCSPLLKDIPYVEINKLLLSNNKTPASIIFSFKQQESFIDNKAPPILAEQKIYGGADMIKQQAACPFRAFATYRLHAKKLELTTHGLNHKDRGIIIHEAMQIIWKEIKSQAALLALNEEQERSIIDKAIITSINNNAPTHHQHTYYLSLEQRRLTKTIKEWLVLEKSRPPFLVSANEQSATIKLNERLLSVRIDRIDTLDNGHKFIIDYKSGKNNSTKKWFSDRPDEPQLPLYVLIDPANTAGISFAQLAAGNIRYKGISQTDIHISGIDTETHDWIDHLAKWRLTLGKLVEDFCNGEAAADPKRGAVTCKDCNVIPICRIQQVANIDFNDDAIDEDENLE